jgi:hypothetical protein
MTSTALRRCSRYAVSLLLIAGMTGLLLPFRAHLNILNVALLYLIVLAVLALRTTTGPAIAASLAAFLCFNLFFIPPYYTFTVARPDHVLTLFVFLGIAVLITQLIVRVHSRTAEALRRGHQMAILYELSTALSGETGLDNVPGRLAARVQEIFSLETCGILLKEDGDFRVRAVAGESVVDLSDRELLALARFVMETRQVAGLGTTRAKLRPPGPPGRAPRWNVTQASRNRGVLLLPIVTTSRPLGVFLSSVVRIGLVSMPMRLSSSKPSRTRRRSWSSVASLPKSAPAPRSWLALTSSSPHSSRPYRTTCECRSP